MSEFFFSTRFFKRLPSSENDIKQQLNILKKIINKIVGIDSIFSTWYINNPVGTKPPLDYLFPSEKSDKYLLKIRKKDEFQSYSLWNGADNSNFVGIDFDTFDFRMNFEKVLECDQIIEIFRVVLDHIEFQYIYLNSYFFSDINIFPHRLETTSICYVPKIIDENQIPHLYRKIEINNELNQGTILIFDENLFDESDAMKKKIQDNSIVLVDLGLIPEAELHSNFF